MLCALLLMGALVKVSVLMGNAADHSLPRLNTFSIDGQNRVKRGVRDGDREG